MEIAWRVYQHNQARHQLALGVSEFALGDVAMGPEHHQWLAVGGAGHETARS